MRQQITRSSGGEIKDINPNQVEAFGRDNTLIDTTQIKQKPVFGKFTISATGDYTMNIGFIPSLLYIDAFEDGHSPFSHGILKADYNVCRYVDSGGNNSEASLNTIIHLSHAGVTSATIKSFGKKVIITCNSYNHSSKVHWEAFP